MHIFDSLDYNYVTGEIYIVKEGVKVRKLIPDDNLMIQTSIHGEKLKMKYDKLCFILFNRTIDKDWKMPDNYFIHHKDFDESNCKGSNLMLVNHETKKKINEAFENLNGALKLVPHKSDAFSYVLEYKHEGRLKKEVIQDLHIARKKLTKLQLRCIKELNPYIVSN